MFFWLCYFSHPFSDKYSNIASKQNIRRKHFPVTIQKFAPPFLMSLLLCEKNKRTQDHLQKTK